MIFEVLLIFMVLFCVFNGIYYSYKLYRFIDDTKKRIERERNERNG